MRGTTLKHLIIPVTASIGIHVAAVAVFLDAMPPTEPPKPLETIQVTLVNEDAMRKGVSDVFESDVSKSGHEQASSTIMDTEHALPVMPIDSQEDSAAELTSYEITKTSTRRQIVRTINPATNYAFSNESVSSNLHELVHLERLPIVSDVQSQDKPEPGTNQSEQSAAAVSTIEQPVNQSIESSLEDELTVKSEVPETAEPVKLVSDAGTSIETATEPLPIPQNDIELTQEYLNDEIEIRLALVELADAAVVGSHKTQIVRDALDSVRSNTETMPPALENRSPAALAEKIEVTTKSAVISDNFLSAPVEPSKNDGSTPESEPSAPVQLAQFQLQQPDFDTVDEAVTREQTVQTPIEQTTNRYQLNTSATVTHAALKNSKSDSVSEYFEPEFGLKGLHNPAPRYPYLSRVNNEEGRVILLVHVDREGTVEKIDTHESSGFRRLDRAAKKTIKKWTFKPAHVAGIPVAGAVHVPVKFVFND